MQRHAPLSLALTEQFQNLISSRGTKVEFPLDQSSWKVKEFLPFRRTPEFGGLNLQATPDRAGLIGSELLKEDCLREILCLSDELSIFPEQFLHPLPLQEPAVVNGILAVQVRDPLRKEFIVRLKGHDPRPRTPVLAFRRIKRFAGAADRNGLLKFHPNSGRASHGSLRQLAVRNQLLNEPIREAGVHKNPANRGSLLCPNTERRIGLARQSKGKHEPRMPEMNWRRQSRDPSGSNRRGGWTTEGWHRAIILIPSTSLHGSTKNAKLDRAFFHMTPRFECDKCGACCKGNLIVEVEDLDVIREPRVIGADPHHAGKPVEQMVREIQEEWKGVIIAGGKPCSFLGQDNQCSIYPTRPNCCVGLQAGDEQCQYSREADGLPPLLPIAE